MIDFPSAIAEGERELLARAARWPAYPSWADLTEETLRRVTREEGLDFATAVLYDRIVRTPPHSEFIKQLATQESPGLQSVAEVVRLQLPMVVVVPGAFYRDDARSGGDGRFVMEAAGRLGCRTERIPLSSFGPLKENADIIRSWLRQRREPRIVMVSLSKGGAEMKLALAAPDAPEVFHNVSAWISLSGLCEGSPLANWLAGQHWRLPLIRFFFWYHGYHCSALRQLERGPGGLLNFELRPPRHLQIVHVVGFPMTRHLSSPLAGRGHRRIGPLGPNDGGPILLADLRRLPGLIYPVWGADHYLRPARDTGSLVSRLLNYVTEERARAQGSGVRDQESGTRNQELGSGIRTQAILLSNS
jgi:hypothetical protein